MPEYQAILPAYAPRLLATSTEEDAEKAVKGKSVNFMRWLDRFQAGRRRRRRRRRAIRRAPPLSFQPRRPACCCAVR